MIMTLSVSGSLCSLSSRRSGPAAGLLRQPLPILNAWSATMATVHSRVVLAAGAWLLGVVAATGGSLAAVSLIGQSLAAPPTQQLTVSAVNHALASGKREPTPSPAARPSPGRSRQHAVA